MRTSLRKRYIGNRAFYAMALAIAVPIMVQNGITQFVSLLDNIMVGRVGEAEMRGVGVANTLIFVFNLAIFGAVSGAGIFGAQYYGGQDYDGVRHAFRFKLYVSIGLLVLGMAVFLLFGDRLIMLYLLGEGTEAERTASFVHAQNYLRIMLVGFLLFQFLPDKLLGLFSASEAMLAIGKPALRIICFHFLLAGMSIILSSTFQALGNGMFSLIISVCRQLVVLLPAAWLLSKTGNVNMVWWSFVIAELVSVTLSFVFFARLDKKIIEPMYDNAAAVQ